jgi:hypothetical protein
MNSKKAFLGMIGVIALLVLLCGASTYFGYTLIVKEGDKLEAAKLDAEVADKKHQLLDQAIRDIEEYQELNNIAKTVVPQEKDQARTVLELVELAKESGISIVSVQFPASELGVVKKKGKSSGPATARGGATEADGLTQLTEVEGLKGVYEMSINVQADPEQQITYDQLIAYLRKLENNRRTAQVSNIVITPDEDNTNNVSFSLTLKSFVRP